MSSGTLGSAETLVKNEKDMNKCNTINSHNVLRNIISLELKSFDQEVDDDGDVLALIVGGEEHGVFGRRVYSPDHHDLDVGSPDRRSHALVKDEYQQNIGFYRNQRLLSCA